MHRELDKHFLIKDRLREWAAWAEKQNQGGGYPKQVAFATERVDSSNRSTETFHDEAPKHITDLDEAIHELAPGFVRILALEYLDNRPQKTKAAVIGIPRQVFSARLNWIHEQLTFTIFGVMTN